MFDQNEGDETWTLPSHSLPMQAPTFGKQNLPLEEPGIRPEGGPAPFVSHGPISPEP